MKTETFKSHPVAIWDYIKPLLLVWILPVVKRVLELILLRNTDRGFFLETATTVAIVVYGILKLKNYKIVVSYEKIILKSGKLFRKEKFIYKEGIYAAKTEKTVLNLIFGGLTVFLHLDGQDKAIKLRLSETNTQRMIKSLFDE